MAKRTINQVLQQAVDAHKAGQLQEAHRLYAVILKAQPKNPDANHNTGLLVVGFGKIELALPFFKAALEANPRNAQFWYSHIIALIKLERFTDAKVLLDQSKSKGIKGFDFDQLEQRLNEAIKALSIKLDYADANYNMGNALVEEHKLEEAIEAYNKAISIKPDYVDAYYNMGNILQDQGKLEEAIEAYNKAISIKPDHVDAYYNMGIALQNQSKLEEAIEAYNKALDIQPDNADIHHNLSFALLSARDFNQGFVKNKWRWKTKKRDGTFLQSSKPMWNGEKNQRVLVWGEQGIGDELMFSSIIPELYATSLKILVKCDKRLIRLFERSFPVDVIYFSKDQPVPEDEYDFHIPMGSLPLTFRKSLDSFKKSASGFLKYDVSKTESIKAQLMHEYGKKIIGISWKTASTIRSSSSRNIDLTKLVRALDNSNTQFLCLQYGDISDEIEAVKRDFGIEVVQFSDVDNKNDIDGLAALMAACDTVITIDNSTAHLSGALGLTTKLMLPYTANWRWGLSGNSSYWYDAVQLYRQSKVNDWYSVLAQIRL